MHCVHNRNGACHSDRGQAVGLLLVAVFVIVALAFGVATMAIGLTQHSLAQSAADAAALAGAIGGVDEAVRAAERNGGLLLDFTRTDSTDLDASTVTVRVAVGTRSAVARASNVP